MGGWEGCGEDLGYPRSRPSTLGALLVIEGGLRPVASHHDAVGAALDALVVVLQGSLNALLTNAVPSVVLSLPYQFERR